MNGKNKEKGLFRIAVYFNETDLLAIAKDAEELGFRRVGIPIKTQKPHGFANEWLANTDGISKMLKFAYKEYKKNKPKRLEEQAEALRKLKEAEEMARVVGAIK
ncbi:hypothetical protein KKF81_00230 [Candidatus Micrarchaeota archaeon]|nr:hypothetical protein [Candidatus Micrarchaeota archaeon]MBU1165344.1 hypothetical protein [Candidatus Micrarchaeota archaeon]MBU1886254.1 hypothetical protein [Candidatus Micrarchaeota archaeon]